MLLKEIKVLFTLNDRNLVPLLATCIDLFPVRLLYPYTTLGSLDQYLSTDNNSVNRSGVILLSIVTDITLGMEYLEHRLIPHPDLNMRSCIVFSTLTSNIIVVKLSNIVATRAMREYMRILKNTRHTSIKDDMYAYGCVIRDIYSTGKVFLDTEKKKEPQPVDMLSPEIEIPFAIRDVVDKCTNGNVTICFGSFSDIVILIQKISTICNGQPVDSMEINPAHLSEIRQLGEGEFGIVMLMFMKHVNTGFVSRVAVKTLKTASENASLEMDFYKEMEMLRSFRHRNIVQMVGYTTRQRPLCLVLEYMMGKNINV